MNLLFIGSILSQNWDHLKALSFILLVFYICVLIAIMIDLCAGVERAKRNGEIRTSYGFRQTIYKVRDYYSVMVLFTLIDIVASLWFQLPFFTAISTIGLVFVEMKSVYENKKDISKGIKDLPNVLHQIVKDENKLTKLIQFLDESGMDIPKKIKDK